MKTYGNVYCFSLFEAGYSSIHSLIRELFDSPKNICPSLSQGDLLYVLSNVPPIKPLHHSCQKGAFITQNDKNVSIKTHVAFCNRHKKDIIPKSVNNPKYPKIDTKTALEKFCLLSGLKTGKASCDFLGPHREQKKDGRFFNIHNTFHIEGLFYILDHDKFNRALIEGIGSRKSYGYGLILIKEGEKYELAS